jgi:hypothetical protein
MAQVLIIRWNYQFLTLSLISCPERSESDPLLQLAKNDKFKINRPKMEIVFTAGGAVK